MRRPLVELTLLIALLLVVSNVWADKRPKSADDYPSEVATAWFDTLYEVVKSEATALPRSLADLRRLGCCPLRGDRAGCAPAPFAGGSVAQFSRSPAAQGSRNSSTGLRWRTPY